MPSTNGSAPPLPPSASSWLALVLLTVLGPPVLGALLASCGESEPAVPPRADAGAQCEPGTQGCVCDESNTCDRGLLCISRRCLPTEGSSGNEPTIRRPAPIADCGSPP